MSKLISFGNYSSNTSPQKNAEHPSIEFMQFEEGTEIEETLFATNIIFVTEGSFFLSYDHFLNIEIKAGKIILLPPGSHFIVRAATRMSFFVFRIKENIPFLKECDNESKGVYTEGLSMIEVNPGIQFFFTQLENNIAGGLIEEDYLVLKTKELIYLICTFYTKEEFNRFFSPLFSPDSRFHHFVLSNYRSVKTVRELADKYNCSVSNFEKKFRRSFGMPPHQWMQKKKVNTLYQDISLTDKPLSEIAKEQMFPSLSQFNDYCKKHFGYPPGKMRKLASLFKEELNRAEGGKMDKIKKKVKREKQGVS